MPSKLTQEHFLFMYEDGIIYRKTILLVIKKHLDRMPISIDFTVCAKLFRY